MSCINGKTKTDAVPRSTHPGRKKQLTDIAEGLGVTQIHLCGTLMEWFARQPDTVQAAVLGLYPNPIEKDVATLILKQIEQNG